MTSAAIHQLHHLVQQTAAGAATSSVTAEFGKGVGRVVLKFSPQIVFASLKGSTRDPSLIFGYLERVLWNLTDMVRSSMELLKVLHDFLAAFLTLVLYLC